MQYILSDAQASYIHWWTKHTSIRLWLAYWHLDIPELGYVKHRWVPTARTGGFTRPWSLSTSGESSFRQEGITKKAITEDQQAKIDWRKRKGFAKDHSKHRTWCKCRRYLKTQDHRLRRRSDKRLIRAGKFDEIYHHKEMFVSSWDAC
jgi:hypothetical protein